jgi:hypothetical protein
MAKLPPPDVCDQQRPRGQKRWATTMLSSVATLSRPLVKVWAAVDATVTARINVAKNFMTLSPLSA